MNTLNSCKLMAFIPTANLGRAREFYKFTLGFRLLSEDAYGMIFEVSNSLLRVVNIQQVFPARYTVLGWKVPNIQAAAAELAQKGIKFEHYEGFTQDEQGIWKSPDGTQVAWFHDPDLNILSLTQLP